MDLSTLARFEAKTLPINENGCIIWTGALNTKGYGVLGLSPVMQEAAHGKRIAYAHRLSYEHFVDTIPAGLMMRHSCDTRACVNPAHLSVGTAKDNAEDCVTRNRHGSTKLSREQVQQMRQRYTAGGITCKEMAAEFGVSTAQCYAIARRKYWKHVED